MKKKKTILITGASSGLGKHMREIFEAQGNTVIGISRTKYLENDYACDVADDEMLKKTIDEIAEKYGKFDMVITCAGYGLSGAIELLPQSDAKRQFDVNFFGTVSTCKHALAHMKEKSKIIIVSSATALFPLPFKAFYSASKSAVDAFAHSLRAELSRTKIQVTSICPGDVRTNFTANRVKKYETNERYGTAVENSTKPTEKTEKRRMSQEYASKKMVKICKKWHLKSRYIIGKQYKFFNFCKKVFSDNFITHIVTKMFYKK